MVLGIVIVALPESRPEDDEDVVWGLSTASALWARGERRDAIVWLRRAAEAAVAAGQEFRGSELGMYAGELEDTLNTADANGEAVSPEAAAPSGTGLASAETIELLDIEADRPSQTSIDLEEEGLPFVAVPPPPGRIAPTPGPVPPPRSAFPPPAAPTPISAPPPHKPASSAPKPITGAPPVAASAPPVVIPPPAPVGVSAPQMPHSFEMTPMPSSSLLRPGPSSPRRMTPSQPRKSQPRGPILDPWADEPTDPGISASRPLVSFRQSDGGGDELVLPRRTQTMRNDGDDEVVTSAAPLDASLTKKVEPRAPRKVVKTGPVSAPAPGQLAQGVTGVPSKGISVPPPPANPPAPAPAHKAAPPAPPPSKAAVAPPPPPIEAPPAPAAAPAASAPPAPPAAIKPPPPAVAAAPTAASKPSVPPPPPAVPWPAPAAARPSVPPPPVVAAPARPPPPVAVAAPAEPVAAPTVAAPTVAAPTVAAATISSAPPPAPAPQKVSVPPPPVAAVPAKKLSVPPPPPVAAVPARKPSVPPPAAAPPSPPKVSVAPAAAPVKSAPPPPPVLLDGLPLDEVDAFVDLPPEMQQRLVALARIEPLAADEEVSSFGAALLLSGEASVCATIVDTPACRAAKGTLVPSRGSLAEAVGIRVVAGAQGARVAIWEQPVIEDALKSCPWVLDELVSRADRIQALAGATMGALGEVDEASRNELLDRLTVHFAQPFESLIDDSGDTLGITVVGGGGVDLGAHGDLPAKALHPGEMLFAQAVLEGRPAPRGARAGASGALVLIGEAKIAKALMASSPPLAAFLGDASD